MLDKKTIVTMLVESDKGCEVKFRKVDGTERVMWATLNSNLIPPKPEDPAKTSENPKPKKNKGLTESNDHVVVWDLEKNAWRSFRCDSILRLSRERTTVEQK